MPFRIFLLVVFLSLSAPAGRSQEYSCTAPQAGGGVRYACESGNGCWVVVWEGGRSQGGCVKGRDVGLFAPISAEFKGVPLDEVITALTRGRNLEVKIVGDSKKRVTFAVEPRPLQLVLLDLQRLTAVDLETAWLPRLSPDQEFSLCVNAKASDVSMLLYAMTGREVKIPIEKRDVRVSLKLRDVIHAQAADELLKALR